MHAFRAGLVVMLIIEFAYISGITFLLLFKCKKYCDRRRSNQDRQEPGDEIGQEIGKQVDVNGVHVELADYDDGENTDKKNADNEKQNGK